MNKKQKNILAGRKHKQRVADRPSEKPVWGPSPILTVVEWVSFEEQMRKSILMMFWRGSLGRIKAEVTASQSTVSMKLEGVLMHGDGEYHPIELSGGCVIPYKEGIDLQQLLMNNEPLERKQ